jgi:hypothetical protein
MLIERLLLAMETVQLAKIDIFIRTELQRRAEYAIKFGAPAPRRNGANRSKIPCRSMYSRDNA